MKRYISYFAVLLAVLLGAACSKDDSAAGSDNRTGVMAMTVSTRQTADTGEYDPLQHQTVYIYNDEGGLLRKYTSKEPTRRRRRPSACRCRGKDAGLQSRKGPSLTLLSLQQLQKVPEKDPVEQVRGIVRSL